MKHKCTVYLTGKEHYQIAEYAESVRRSFSEFVGLAALAEMKRQQTRKNRRRAAMAIPTGIDADLSDKIRHNL